MESVAILASLVLKRTRLTNTPIPRIFGPNLRPKSTSNPNETISNLVKFGSKTTDKRKKATIIKKLHQANKDMFGELLETRQEKTKRLKLEKIKASMIVPESRLDQIDTENDISTKVESVDVLQRMKSKIKAPKSLPMSLKLKIPKNSKSTSDHPFQVDEPQKIFTKAENKVAEIDWVLKTNPKMTKVMKYLGTRKNEPNPTPLSLDFLYNPSTTHTDNQMDENQNQIISIPFPRSFNTNKVNENLVPNEDEKVLNLNLQLPSVSKILNTTMPKEQAEALARWQARMISEMGEEGFRLYKENMLNSGKMLHSNMELYMRGTPLDEIPIPDSISGHWSSLKNILPWVADVQVLESRVVHPKLKYCGIVDCVAVYKDKLVVIDWKTSQKPKPIVSMTYDTPLQIVAYIGAINHDPNYSLKIDGGLIVIAYEDGRTGHAFLLQPADVEKYWLKWIQRLNQFYSAYPNETPSA